MPLEIRQRYYRENINRLTFPSVQDYHSFGKHGKLGNLDRSGKS